MLFPKKVKHRKWQSARKNPSKLLRPDTRGTTVAFGTYGLKATTSHRITSNQIEAARKVLSRATGKGGKMWIRIFPDRPVTEKAAGMKMGKGKGDPQRFVFEVRPGRVMFEVDGITEPIARDALRRAGAKLPVKTSVVVR
jgi:large subunit ribosomal protein L16